MNMTKDHGICQTYDDPKNLYIKHHNVVHRECASQRQKGKKS